MTYPSLHRFIRILCLLTVTLAASLAFGGDPAPSPEIMVEIADVGKGRELAALLSSKGFRTSLATKNMGVTDVQTNCAVWIGKKVPLAALKVVLPEAMKSNPYLTFFHVVGDRGETPPARVDSTIHIGGSIEGAAIWKLNPIDQKEMLDILANAKTQQELHDFLHQKNIPKEETPQEKQESMK